MAKYRITSIPQAQNGGQKDSWGRPSNSIWYGFDPGKKQFTTKDAWGRSPGSEWYGFNPELNTWTKGNKVQQAVKKESQKVQDYYRHYMNSPMYKEMLGFNPDIDSKRKENLGYSFNDTPSVSLIPQDKDKPNTGGWSIAEHGNIKIMPKGLGVKGLLPHEWSHSIDRPRGSDGQRLIPQKDIDYIKKTTVRDKDVLKLPSLQNYSGYSLDELKRDYPEWTQSQIDWKNYVGKPTEVRARLNDIRYQSKQRGLYDPFTQKVTPEIYEILKNTEFEKGENKGFDALKQLKDIYTDEEIMYMLNNISKNEPSNNNVDYVDENFVAKLGGLTKAQKGKIVKLDNTPTVEVQGVEQPSYWNDTLPAYMRGEGCPPGKYEYNGQCLTEPELVAAYNAEKKKDKEEIDAKSLARKLALVKDINDIRSKANQQQEAYNERRNNEYLETFAKSKKSDKIEPWKRYPETDVTPEIEAEFKNNFLVHKKDGFVELFPKNIVQDRIIKNGFQAEQFKNYWGLDPKQVKEQLGDLMGAAKAQYEAEVTQNIFTKAIQQGKPVDQVIKELSPKIGQQSNLKSTFEKPVNKIIDDTYNDLLARIDSTPGVNQAQVEKDRRIFLESDDPMDAWERTYHSGQNNLADFFNYQTEKTKRGKEAYSKYMDEYGNTGQYDGLTFAKDDAMANVRQNNALLNQSLNQKNAISAKEAAKAKDFNEAYENYLANLGANSTKEVLKQAFEKAGSTTKGKLNVIKSFQNNPIQALEKLLQEKTGNENETYANRLDKSFETMLFREQNPQLQHTIKEGTINNVNTTGSKIMDVLTNPFDAIYYAMHPREEMWGDWNTNYRNRKALEKEFNTDYGTMPINVMSPFNITSLQAFNPFKVGDNLRRGYDKGNFLSTLGNELIDMGTSRGLAKGFNALGNLRYINRMAGGKNLLSSGVKNTVGLGKGIKTVLKDLNNPLMNAGLLAQVPENFSNAFDEFESGNYGTAAIDATIGALGISPLKSGLKTLNSLRRPGTVLSNPNLNTQYTGLYNAATPGSGIGVGNPVLSNASPVFQSITNPINKLSKGLGFGEFSVLKQNPKGYLQTGSYPSLGYKDGGLVKAQSGFEVLKTAANALQALGKSGKTAARIANIGTIGTANSLAKALAPVMIHPTKVLTLGQGVEGVGPFTGSPLNFLPFYGKDLSSEIPNTAFRKFGDTLDYVKNTGVLSPEHGPLLRIGKGQIANEGNWAELFHPNESYPGVFGAQFNFNTPNTDLGYQKISKRNGVLITDAQGNTLPRIPISDPGLQFQRRLPFSNRYVPVNMDALRNDQFDPATMGGNLQSLLERYGYAALGAAGLGAVGFNTPQEYLDEYVTNPVKKGYKKVEDLLTNPWTQPKRKNGGVVTNLSKKEINKYIKDGYIIEDV